MKHIKKIFAFALTLVMAIAFAVPAGAQEGDSQTPATGTITITLPTDPKPTGKTVYNIYKVFDATSDGTSSAIAYKLARGNKAEFLADDSGISTYFDVDDAGNVTVKAAAIDTATSTDTDKKLTSAAIQAIAAYAKKASPVKTLEVAAGNDTVTETVGYGYFYIDTTTGTAVTIDSTNPNATVNDKNGIPTVNKSLSNAQGNYDKDSLKAIAEVGTTKNFTAEIHITKGATNIVFTDAMTNMSLTGDVAITVDGTAVADDNYTFATTDNGFTVSFDNDYVKTLEGKTIKLNYTGTITSDALSVNPATNKATITYGDTNNTDNKQESEEVKVYNAKFTVTKKDGAGAALAGAGFVVKNADGKYYQLNSAKNDVTWVDNIAQATEYTSDAQGNVPAFTGLGAGTYTLVEKTVPNGYNKAVDSTFTVSDTDYTTTNLEQASTVTNNQGTEMPSTGGIGTTIFYVVGGVMVAGAVVFLLTKRRAAAE